MSGHCPFDRTASIGPGRSHFLEERGLNVRSLNLIWGVIWLHLFSATAADHL